MGRRRSGKKKKIRVQAPEVIMQNSPEKILSEINFMLAEIKKESDNKCFELANDIGYEVTLPAITNPRPGNLQSVVVSKEVAKSKDEAVKIAKDFGAKHTRVDENDTQYRFRQRNPGDFIEGSFRTFKAPAKAGVTLIYGKLK